MANLNLLRSLARSYGIDPAAALAVASSEGLNGAIGDGGHAFGPWQLNNAGGVLTNMRSGTPQQLNSWAWSPEGLKFALARMAPVARGLHGAQAVQAIVRGFERPAAPGAEIQRALAALPRFGGTGGGQVAGPVSAFAPAPPVRTTQGGLNLNNLVAAIASGKDISSFLPGMVARGTLQAPVSPSQPSFRPMPLPSTPGMNPGVRALPYNNSTDPFRGHIAELLHEGVGGPTHSTGEHIHVASQDPNTVLAAIGLAQKLGLRVGENPYTDPVDPVHATNSYHYRRFPGLYNGKPLGEAIDASGSGAAMRDFYARLARLK